MEEVEDGVVNKEIASAQRNIQQLNCEDTQSHELENTSTARNL